MDGAVTLHIGSEIEKADGQVVKAGNTAMQANGNSAENIAAELKESTVESVDRQVRESAAEISAAQPESGGQRASPESAAYSFSSNSVTHPVLSSTLAPTLI